MHFYGLYLHLNLFKLELMLHLLVVNLGTLPVKRQQLQAQSFVLLL
jgi:hypothetical protein